MAKLVAVATRDILGITLVVAIILHSILILGVNFEMEDFRLPEAPLHALDIILVHNRSEQAPEEADYLAQANQDGGGDSPELVRQQSPLSSPRELPVTGEAPVTQAEQTPRQQEKSKPDIIATPAQDTRRKATTVQPEAAVTDRATAQELLAQSIEVARMSAEVDATPEYRSHRTRHKAINARTREYRYASYMDSWRRKVERIGNLNYPAEARRQGLHGSLVLDVAINPDGSILEIKLLKSSGEAVLDAAARRIVELAGPYAPLPQNIRKDVDVLHIIRTWQFQSDNRLFSGR